MRQIAKNMTKILPLFMASLLFSCIAKYQETPPELIQEPKMCDIFIDMHIAEAIIQQQNLQGDSATAAYVLSKNAVLKKHETDTATYRKSLNYYNEHPAQYKKIYEAVVDSLALREQRGILK
jgi:hypothetical protein